MKYIVKTFENVSSFADYCKRAPICAAYKGADLQSEKVSGYKTKWTGTENYSAADALLQYGDRENAAKIIAETAGRVKSNNADDIRAKRFRSVCGSSVNVAAALVGRPKAMYKIERKITNTKVLNFAFNCAADWTIDADKLAAVAVRLTSAILGIEKKGYRINLYVCMIAKERQEISGAFVKIKDSKTYIDKTKIAYPLINPSFLRRHSFAFMERNEGLKDAMWTMGYGQPVRDAEQQKETAAAANLKLQKIVNYYDLCDLDAAGIIDYLLK